jgi:dipeptidyl aminopeptidase/acylaminoacyl peptidase
MKSTLLAFLAASVLLSSCGSEDRAPTDETKDSAVVHVPKLYEYDDFDKNINFSGGLFTHDEKAIVYTSNETGIRNLFSIPFGGGEKTQLTFSEIETYYLLDCFPNDGRIVFGHDQGGNENGHIYIRNEDGEEIDLTPAENAKNIYYEWNDDFTAMNYVSNRRDPQFFDLYQLTIAQIDEGDYEAEMIFKNTDGYQIGAITPDETTLAVSKQDSRKNSDIYILDLASGDAKLITEHEGDISHSPQVFGPDAKYLYYSTDEGSDFRYLKKYNLETGESEVFYQTDWDVQGINYSRSGDHYTLSVNQDASNILTLHETATGSIVELPDIDGQTITGLRMAPSQTKMRFVTTSTTSPGNTYSYDMVTEKVTLLNNGLNPDIDEADLVAGKVIRYKSFDGLEIPSILYVPHGASETNKVPCMLMIHGGPGGQSRMYYNTTIQYLVNNGYAILQVNNRGSSGYGKGFFALDDLRHGEDDLQDCIESKKYLETLGYINMDEVGIMGGSYGGYMTMAALTFAPEEFKVGVNIFGVTNWLRTLRSIPAHWETQREGLYKELGDPNSIDSVRLKKISPLFHTENITKPLMVLQGANDVRVLQVESDEIVAGAEAKGVPVEYVLFPDEGHGFRKKKNEKEAYMKIKQFLDKYLVSGVVAVDELED